METVVTQILHRYGMLMDLIRTNGEKGQVRGLFQPVRSKSWQNAVNLASPLGEVSRGQYVYIGPASVLVEEGDVLEIGQKQYRFHRVEPYYYAGEAVYLWGLCVEKGGDSAWGSQS